MIKNVIAIYPGRFQPMGKHHKDAFKWLENKFGAANTYIATSDKVDPPKSPLNFKEKKSIAKLHGVAKNLVQVKNPYKAEEITSKYDPKTTAVVFMVGQKDMQEDPRFRIGQKKDGTDSYFQKYEPNKPMKPYTEHGYLIVAPHVSYDIKGVGEMSGTNIRKALSDPKSTPEQFKDIFGWYDKDIESMLKKKFSTSMKENKNIFEIIEERAVLSTLIRTLLAEGGAAGHMAHPFDIPKVKTGKDLENVFVKTADFLSKNPVPVKIDGINASIRLGDIKGKRQFVIDRGSNKPLDVQGVSKKDLTDRFGEGHGMIKIGGKVLDIFNKALPSITPELKALGMIDNPNIMLNIEYVEGQSNVQKYDNNFLAIHNLLELVRVSPTKRATQEIPYDKKALQGLIKKVAQVANKEGFQVMGEIPAKMDSKPNFGSALSKSYTVVTSPGKKETKTLQQWLAKAKNTKGEKLKLKDGKTVDALSKQVFIWVKDGKPVSDLVADPEDTQKAIDSYVIYMATMVLGDVILGSLSSPIGDVKDQEGIVVRDKEVYSSPYKITGSFILRGMQSAFQK
jgi:hypothetical protein